MKVRINYSENLHFIASARNFKNLQLDEPESFHGTDLGPSSVEYLLIGIGGCLGSTFTYCLQKQQIEIENLEIVVEGQLKHSGPKLRLQLVHVEVEIFYTLKPGYSEEKLMHCLNIYEEYCVISNSIHQGLPLTVHTKEKN